MDKPQIVLHSTKSLDYTTFDVKWIPQTPRYVTIGQMANGTGVLEIHSLQGKVTK
ncbi:WD repeat-containing protein 92, partial [Kappamyces sp. JEL0680]